MNSAPAASPALSFAHSALLRRSIAVVLGSLFVAICAHVAVPLWFTPVPMTLQPFAVLLLGLILSPLTAASALALYLVEGAAGLPVLVPHGPVGLVHLFGPTGGYLLAYPFATACTSWLRRRLGSARFAASLLASSAGDALILLSGAAWLAILTHQPASVIFSLAVAPFLAGEVLKVITASGIATGMRRFRRA